MTLKQAIWHTVFAEHYKKFAAEEVQLRAKELRGRSDDENPHGLNDDFWWEVRRAAHIASMVTRVTQDIPDESLAFGDIQRVVVEAFKDSPFPVRIAGGHLDK